MGAYVAGQLIKAMIKKSIQIEGAGVLTLGLSFKENCPDLRNTRVIDIISELQDYHCRVDVHDPWADAAEAQAEYGIALVDQPDPSTYDAIVLAVAHDAFKAMGAEQIHALGKTPHVLYDLKYLLLADPPDLRL
jgi:UDP-N-acetyl-D-galactosamine dehydrogenase